MTLAERATGLAATLPPLALRAERLARLIMQGSHPRGRPGSGYNFWQFRRYSQNDAATLIDWRRSGRSQRLYVREHEWETSQALWIWVDPSAGMDFAGATDIDSKLTRSHLIAVAMGLLARMGGEQVALAGGNLFNDHGHLLAERLCRALARQEIPDGLDGDSFALPADLIPPRNTHMLVISDFMADSRSMEKGLERLARRGIQAQLVQVLDPLEAAFPFEGRIDFIDPATHRHFEIGESLQVADQYRARLAERQDQIAAACRRFGWQWHHHVTDHAPETLVLALYAAMRDQQDIRQDTRGAMI